MDGPENFPKFDSDQGIIALQEISTEQTEILAASLKFAEYITERWSQVDNEPKIVVEVDKQDPSIELPEMPKSIETLTRPKLNYYLSGSLASMLLSKAESFTVLESRALPELKDEETQQIPEKTKNILATFARQIGDLDYVPTEHYKTNPNRLRKGGGGPSFDEIPEGAKLCLKRSEGQIKLMCDPLEAYGEKRVARIKVEGKSYYIARPDAIFGYKILHLLLNYESKSETFNSDFGKLLAAMKEMYSEEELIKTVRQILTDYESAMQALHVRMNAGVENPINYEPKVPKSIHRVMANPNFTNDLRLILQKIELNL